MDIASQLSGTIIVGLHLLFFGLFFIRGPIPDRRHLTIFSIALLCGFSPITGFPILLIFFSPLVGKMIAMPLYRSVADPAETGVPYDLIVVPTAGVQPDGNGAWRASLESSSRLEAGRAIQQRFGIPLLLIGGAADSERPSEAEVIGAEGDAAEAGLLLDSEPLNSWQTGRRVARILEHREKPRVVLVTATYHMLRMAASLRSAGVGVSGVCTDLRGYRRAVRWSDVIPNMHGLNLVRTATHEYLMTLWYSLKGRLRLADLTTG